MLLHAQTAATLTFAVYMLSQHPDVHVRLREEIIAKVGVSGRPTHDDLRGMKYLRAFINGVQLAIISRVLISSNGIRGPPTVSTRVRFCSLNGIIDSQFAQPQ
jgi:hypothetical protein